MTETEKASSEDERAENFSALFKGLQIGEDFVWVDVDDIDQPVIKLERTLSNKSAHDNNTDDALIAPVVDKGIATEQKYWKQLESIEKLKKSKPKFPNCGKQTQRDYGKNDSRKTKKMTPSDYNLDIATTRLLEITPGRHVSRAYHNVLGRGNSSIVIHVEYKWPSPPHMAFWTGYAVKIYKMSYDVARNNKIFKRAQKEYTYLLLAQGISYTPRAVHHEKNVIIMQFVGSDQECAPSIATLPSERCREFYEITVSHLENWYNKLNLVHGRLSTKNIRNAWDRPYFIGWSHAVKRDHPKALQKLLRDCHFVNQFFGSRGVAVKSTAEIYNKITELNITNIELDDALHRPNLWKSHHLTNPNRLHLTSGCNRINRFK